MIRQDIFPRLFFVAMVGLAAAYLFYLGKGLEQARQNLAAREGMRKLAALTIRNFPDRNLESPELFWKSIGRNAPIQDPWGRDYLIDSRGVNSGKSYFWRSAGPDGSWGNEDDLALEVPYALNSGTSVETTPAEPEVASPPSAPAQ